MTEEEIKSRILVCEVKERDYREVSNTKTADRYHNEIQKWNGLLDKLNPRRDKDLEQFRKGYYRLEGKIEKAIEYINEHHSFIYQDNLYSSSVNEYEYDVLIYEDIENLLKILEEVEDE